MITKKQFLIFCLTKIIVIFTISLIKLKKSLFFAALKMFVFYTSFVFPFPVKHLWQTEPMTNKNTQLTIYNASSTGIFHLIFVTKDPIRHSIEIEKLGIFKSYTKIFAKKLPEQKFIVIIVSKLTNIVSKTKKKCFLKQNNSKIPRKQNFARWLQNSFLVFLKRFEQKRKVDRSLDRQAFCCHI